LLGAEYFFYINNNFMFSFPVAGDFEPDDVLTDPGLKHQLELTWGLGNVDGTGSADQGAGHLPETHVKTLPFEEDEASFKLTCFW
jgi:hypothetical protein